MTCFQFQATSSWKRFCMLIPPAPISQACGCQAAKSPAGVTSGVLIRGDKSHRTQPPQAMVGFPQSSPQPAPQWVLLPSLGRWHSHTMRMVAGSRLAWSLAHKWGHPSPWGVGRVSPAHHPCPDDWQLLSPFLCWPACEAKLGTPLTEKSVLRRITTTQNTGSSLP